ncbi:rhodopsin-like protein [Halorubrum californiense DSM 19288]|uniref:Rhodopsin-like protein n=1 Tax=Halorubrum californiense DSM 19288 TaxID=1227465 RepID=M0DYN0_9EURY|nr:rhodopsin-like protein [Halorubrum californiense DSM 19288]
MVGFPRLQAREEVNEPSTVRFVSAGIYVLIAWTVIQIAGLLDQFTATVTLEYLDLLLRVGFAGFVFANEETLTAEVDAGSDGTTGSDVGKRTAPAVDTGTD